MKQLEMVSDNEPYTMKVSSPILTDTARMARFVGHLGLLTFLALSILMAHERVLLTDSAAQLFELIQRGTFVIYDHRYTMAVTQLLPLLGIKLGLPLPFLVILYSSAAPLLAYLVFLLLAYRWHNTRSALLLLLPLLCIRHTFFHAISETYSLLIYATLLHALLQRQSHTPLHYVALVLCIIACVFVHPIGMFFALFLLGYHFVDYHFRPKSGLTIAAAVLIVSAIVKLQLPSGHDSSYMPTLADIIYRLAHPNEIQILHGLTSSPISFCALALYATALTGHLCKRRWLLLAWGIVFNAGFFLLSAVIYYADNSSIAFERTWLPLVFFAGIPLTSFHWPAPARRFPLTTLPAIALLAGLLVTDIKIVRLGRDYRERLDALQTLVDHGRRNGHRKLVIPLQEFRPRHAVDSWATAFETLILSSLHGPDSSVTLYLEEQEPFRTDNSDYQVLDAYLAVPWNRLWNYNTLNPRYFRLPAQPYVAIDAAGSDNRL